LFTVVRFRATSLDEKHRQRAAAHTWKTAREEVSPPTQRGTQSLVLVGVSRLSPSVFPFLLVSSVAVASPSQTKKNSSQLHDKKNRQNNIDHERPFNGSQQTGGPGLV